MYETEKYDTSALDPARSIAFVQVCDLLECPVDPHAFFPASDIALCEWWQDDTGANIPNGLLPTPATPLAAVVPIPFLYYLTQLATDPFSFSPWTVADWQAGKWQVGPGTNFPD
jgi:hypothetical protein